MNSQSNPLFRQWIAFAAILLLSLLAPASAKAGKPAQPRMHAALDALHAARSAVDPIPDLKTAMERLNVAVRNKAGYRVEAMDIIKQAIAEVQAKKRHEADKLIDQAINKVEKGVASGN